MSQNLQQNRGLVESVFNNVYDKYDLMNDIMSLGAHRSWKNNLINMMNPSINDSLIDEGCGTGDIGEIYYKATKKKSRISDKSRKAHLRSLNKKTMHIHENLWISLQANKNLRTSAARSIKQIGEQP